MDKRRAFTRVIYSAAVLVLVLAVIYSGLRILEPTVFHSDKGGSEHVVSKTITRDGVDYFPRQDITVILVMGIDEEGVVKDSGSYRNTGEADMLALLILDQADETYSILTLNRDTMLTMPVLGLAGRQAGTFHGQLALSHTYGSGLEDSAENTRKAVSDFLYGITIDQYIAMTMDAIGILNDAVGGVTVTVEDDFSLVDPTLTKGVVTLRGSQAVTFVRSRMDVGTQMNLSRMERQKAYMEGLMQALGETLEESDLFAAKVYEQLSDYMVTDCTVNVISALMQRCSAYALKQIVSPAGENVLGETYYEFYPDEEQLDALILDLFYAPKS